MEDVWRCTRLGKAAEASVAEGTDYNPRRYGGDFERDTGQCGNMECLQELLVLTPAGWPFKLSANLPWREDWCTAPQERRLLRALSFAA
jgi:hypothetical protein